MIADHALLLRALDYRDSDRVVTLLTRRHGRVSALARGARRSRRRFAGALEPYGVLAVQLRQGRGELWTLTEARLERPFGGVLSDLARMSTAGAALSFVREVSVEHTDQGELFLAAVHLLALLDSEEDADGRRLLAFCLRALSLAGLAPALDRCGRCGRAAPEARAALFDPGSGALVCRACGGAPFKLSGQARGLLSRCFTSAWTDAARATWPADDLRAARAAVAAFVDHQLGAQAATRVFSPTSGAAER